MRDVVAAKKKFHRKIIMPKFHESNEYMDIDCMMLCYLDQMTESKIGTDSMIMVI